MTDDDLDLLASAYLDGEATPQEVALVEGDPELLARVAELRSISGGVGAATAAPPPELFKQHMAAALAEYDAVIGADTSAAAAAAGVAADNTIDFNQRKRVRVSRRDRLAQQAPQWLAAAAGLVLVGGGAFWAATNLGSDDADETASIEFDTSDDAADSSTDDGGDFESEADFDDAGTDAAPSSNESMAAAEAAPLDEGIAEDAAMDDSEEEVEGQSAATEGDGVADRAFQAPFVFLDEVPDPATILDELNQPPLDVGTSVCVDLLELDEGSEVVGYVPIDIAGAPAEVFEITDATGERQAVIVDQTCQPLSPTP
jgi:hypothetical protein